MNILIVAPFFYEPPEGKIGTLRLCKELVKRGNKVYVVSSRILNYPKYEEINGIRVFRQKVIYLSNIPYVIPIEINFIRNMIIKYNIDIVHSHTIDFISSYFALRETKKLKKPFIVSIHSLREEISGIIVKIIFKIFEYTISRKIIKQSDSIIVLSKKLSIRARILGANSDKINVISNGINTEELLNTNSISRKLFSISEKDFVIGYVGRLSSIKGINYLIKAGKSLINKIPNLKILIVGDGPLKESLIKETKSMADKFIFIGYFKNAIKIFNLFDVCVLPSLTEGLSNTMLESLYCGVPIIATNVGGAEDVIRNGFNGILVPPKDYVALKDKIYDLYRNKELRTFIRKNSKKTIIDNYRIENEILKLETLYENILNEGTQVL